MNAESFYYTRLYRIINCIINCVLQLDYNLCWSTAVGLKIRGLHTALPHFHTCNSVEVLYKRV